MKNLFFINGTMGVGKTATSKHLQKALPNCVFLDGNWCWDSSPFIVTEETKAMVIKNIAFLLNSFLACSAYDNIIFCWVMHEDTISESISSALESTQYKLHKISLVCSPDALKERLLLDVGIGIRSDDVIERSLARLDNYKNMDTQKIDVSNISAEQAAQYIFELVCPSCAGR